MQDYDNQVRLELRQRFDTLTAHIASLDVDIGREMDVERRQVLQERRDEQAKERRQVANRLTALEIGVDGDGQPRSRKPERKQTAVEYDELIRLIYEIRSDVAVLKEQMLQLKQRCGGLDVAALPPHLLVLLVVGGIMTLLLLLYVVMRIGAF